MNPKPGSATASDVALLAPVPIQHLGDGAEVARLQGKVAYGSRAFEVFSNLRSLGVTELVTVWIYASHAHVGGPPKVTWTGTYAGWENARAGAHPSGAQFRPPSTISGGEDAVNHWAGFWHVAGLRELTAEEAIPIAEFQGLERKTRYDKRFVPEGPILVRANVVPPHDRTSRKPPCPNPSARSS